MKSQRQRDYKGSLRLPDYDYSQNGAYFVTLITFKRQYLFGKIVQSEVVLNDIGKIVHKTWLEICSHFPDVSNDLFVIMPNHLHGIIVIENNQTALVAATHASQLQREAQRNQESQKYPQPVV